MSRILNDLSDPVEVQKFIDWFISETQANPKIGHVSTFMSQTIWSTFCLLSQLPTGKSDWNDVENQKITDTLSNSFVLVPQAIVMEKLRKIKYPSKDLSTVSSIRYIQEFVTPIAHLVEKDHPPQTTSIFIANLPARVAANLEGLRNESVSTVMRKLMELSTNFEEMSLLRTQHRNEMVPNVPEKKKEINLQKVKVDREEAIKHGLCFRCGIKGHVSKNCTGTKSLNLTGQSQTRSKGCTLDIVVYDQIVTGILDTGALGDMGLVVSSDLAGKLGMKVLKQPLDRIRLPNGQYMDVLAIDNKRVTINGKKDILKVFMVDKLAVQCVITLQTIRRFNLWRCLSPDEKK